MINYGFVKCAIATINSGLSNPTSSITKIKEMIQKAESQKVKVLVFPELSMTGYACQDLFEFTQLIETSMECLKDLVSFSKEYDVF